MQSQLTTLEVNPGIELLRRERIAKEPPFGMSYQDWFKYRAEIGKKKSAVRSKVERIKKNGENKQQGYKYAEAADIYDEVRSILHEERLGFDSDVLEEWTEHTQKGAPITKVRLLITWTDLDTGYFEEMQVIGTGLDYGDKGIYKAYTGAEKYALVLTFMIPTGDDPAPGAADPEKDIERQPQRQPQQPQQPQRQARQSQQRQQPNKRQEQAQEQPQEPEQAKAQAEPEKPTEGTQEPDPAGPITDQQADDLKKRMTLLAGFSSGVDAAKAFEQVQMSLNAKMGIGEVQKSIMSYTVAQGVQAARIVDAWIEDRKEKRRKEEEAAARLMKMKQEEEARKAEKEGTTA